MQLCVLRLALLWYSWYSGGKDSCHGGFIRQQGIPSLACKHIWRRKSEAPLPQGGGVSWDRYRYHQGPQHPIKEAL